MGGSYTAVPVRRSDGVLYGSITEAARAAGVSKQVMYSVVKGVNHEIKGHYYMRADDPATNSRGFDVSGLSEELRKVGERCEELREQMFELARRCREVRAGYASVALEDAGNVTDSVARRIRRSSNDLLLAARTGAGE